MVGEGRLNGGRGEFALRAKAVEIGGETAQSLIFL